MSLLPNLTSPQGGAFTLCRYVEETDEALDLEERALTNYLNEVKNVHCANFFYNPNIHPTYINMFRNPRHHLGDAAKS